MQKPSQQSAISSLVESRLEDVWTSIPCIIVKVTSKEENRVDVQPCVNQLFKDGSVLPYSTIFNVPIMFPCTSRSALSFPVAVGDTVLCVFSQRGLDTFKTSNGYPTTPTDLRKFSTRDAVAIPGFLPFGKSINKQSNRSLPHSTDDVVLAHNLGTGSECEYRLKANGDVVVKSPTKYRVEAPIVEIVGNVETTGTLKNNAVNVGSTHTHTGVHGETSTPH
jgi:hypothetical protein